MQLTANRHYPAEWETQRATWLSWPHNEKEWGKKRIEKIKKFYIELVNKILEFQDVNLIIPNEEFLEETCCSMSQQKKYKLKKIIIPNNDIWIRDYGPFFMETGDGKKKKPVLIDFEFNAWGGKFSPWNLDNNIPKEMAFYLGCEIESYPIIMEGGSLEFSGDGLILTTEQCLLNKNRNPDLSKNEIENILKSVFNTEEIIWLKRGLEGDHTDGHIDDVARFVGPGKILICKSNDKKDNNYEHLNESIEYLKKWIHPKKGYKLEVIELPVPDRIEIKNERLPNSYANFIFVNGGVIIPTFNCLADKKALQTFKKVFPDRKIAGIDCSLLIEEGGGLHCMTKQELLI
ncbi:MAG: hypothetical protein A3I68_00705 [Candidatus Melainabacteria bacterium RIFCSPLOWO2_02_FULL_35_15]|nr:MAG: hypothetical protein A3F80_05625 [Candidatus Melainabacteria bacterium RIFCSPLOWO2_12_FULL_35_11]OGI13468.1 MAG: hypothetical protein A3I68_00705 [Candidatus Melainabacteria bacterium RIFCSPLOWO2_02_FULL_35_15]